MSPTRRLRTPGLTIALALFAPLGTALMACEPMPGASRAPSASSPLLPDVSDRPSLIVPTFKPGSSQAPILTLEPPPPVVP